LTYFIKNNKSAKFIQNGGLEMSIRGKITSAKGKVTYTYRRIYRWVKQISARKGYRKPITWGFGYGELLQAWKFGDVVVGDLIYISNRVLMLAGMNRNGGPGQAMFASFGMPTPVFIPPTPWERRVWTSFDTFYFPPWSKIGHRSKEEWDGMCGDMLNRMLPVVI
jgi:hypothetical protein